MTFKEKNYSDDIKLTCMTALHNYYNYYNVRMIIAVGDRFASWPASNMLCPYNCPYNVTVQRLYKTYMYIHTFQ